MSATAPDVALLLADRATTGAGAAAVLPNTLAVLLHAVPAGRKSATIAAWASMTGIGGVAGNVGGGAVLSGGSWRWLFAAAVPVSLVLAALAGRVAPVSPRHDRRLDPLGAVLLTGASVALLLGIVQGPQAGWDSTVVVAGFACAAALFTAWTHPATAAGPEPRPPGRVLLGAVFAREDCVPWPGRGVAGRSLAFWSDASSRVGAAPVRRSQDPRRRARRCRGLASR
jgi:MFS family permease